MRRLIDGKAPEWAIVVFCVVATAGAIIANEALMAAVGGLSTAFWIDNATKGGE